MQKFTTTVNAGTLQIGDANNLDGHVSSVSVNNDATVGNYGSITTANLNGSARLNNHNTGTIDSVTLDGSAKLYNYYTGTIDSVTLNNGRSYNDDTANIGVVTVNGGGHLDNQSSATIGSVIVNDGDVFNRQTANIGAVTVNGGLLDNDNSATIDSVTVNNGKLRNWSRATIGSVIVNDGDVRNWQTANIGAVTVNGGGFRNQDRATTGSAILNDGWLWNEDSATIGSVIVNGGVLDNYCGLYGFGNACIDTVSLHGGTVANGARINEMTYTGGTYERYSTRYGIIREEGSIGTLTLAGNTANNTGDWGIVENLQFADNGSGILTISGFVDRYEQSSLLWDPSRSGKLLGIQVNFTSGIEAQNIDFTNGNLVLDLTGGFDYFEFSYNSIYGTHYVNSDDLVINPFIGHPLAQELSLASLFGVASIDEMAGLNSFEVFWDDGFNWGWDLFAFLNDGMFEDGWTWTDTGLLWGDLPSSGGDGSVPEPATLVILGLGLAGLGLARRRK